MGVILVTGASRGIGRGIALALSQSGHTVAVHYNGNRQAAEQTVAACQEQLAAAAGVQAQGSGGTGGQAREGGQPGGQAQGSGGTGGQAREGGAPPAAFQADISDAGSRERLVTEVLEHYGALDGLVNNAGIAPRRRDDILEAQESIFEEVMAVNLNGPYFLTQLVARHWSQNPGQQTRRIVFVTSVSSVMPSTNRGEYCISKAALSMAVQLYAARLAELGIPVIEVRPGITKTDMTAGVTEKYDTLIADGLVPQRRWGLPEDTGQVVRAVMDGQLDFSTGSVIATDGGLLIQQL